MKSCRPAALTCLTLAAAAGVATLSGCTSPGGYGYTSDKFCYVSDSHSPKTVSLMDTRTRQILWTTEVPVGQQLVVKFYGNVERGSNMTDVMKYGFADAGSYSGSFTSSIPVPGEESRRLDVNIRPIPEFAANLRGPAPLSNAPAATTPKPDAVPANPAAPTTPDTPPIDLPETEPAQANPKPEREVK